MQNGRTLEERTGTDGGSWYTRRNSQIRLGSPSRNLTQFHSQNQLTPFQRWMETRTRDTPGDGLASVLIMIVSLSPANNPQLVFSYDVPLTLWDCRTGIDQIPRAPPKTWSLRFVRTGRSRWEPRMVSNEASERFKYSAALRTWKSVKPPR